jgi:SAM-dependent methyltransferase
VFTAEFQVMDVRHLDLPARFDAAVCMYDSLNHLTGPQDLRSALAALHDVLPPGGILVFDFNTRAALEGWRPVTRSDDDAAWIVEPRFDADARRAVFTFTGFRQVDGLWKSRCRARADLVRTYPAASGLLHAATLPPAIP